ncbi:MAG TPA: hypothetical protein V6D00_14980 [Pantanalinema sp.]
MRALRRSMIVALAVTGCAPATVSPAARAPQAIAPGLGLYQARIDLALELERRVQALPAPAAWDTVVVTVSSQHLKAPLVSSPLSTSAASLSVGFSVPVGSASIEAALFHGGASGSLIASGSTAIALVAGPNVATLSVQPTGGTLGTLVGSGGTGFSPNGTSAASALLNQPTGVVMDASGSVLFVERANHSVRMVPKVPGTYFGVAMDAGRVYTVAGDGSPGNSGDGGPATAARLQYPTGLALDPLGSLYIADTTNNKIRRVNPSGTITTFAGNGVAGPCTDGYPATSAQLSGPSGVAVDASGNLYIADSGNHLVCMVPVAAGSYFGKSMAANSLYKIAGTGIGGFDGDGMPGTSTRLAYPTAVALNSWGDLVVADTMNHRVRLLPAVAGNRYGQGLAADAMATIAGTGTAGFNADFIAGMSAQLANPSAVAIDSAGNVLIADSSNHRIRKLGYDGQISTLAGGSGSGFENGLATVSGKFSFPWGIALTPFQEVVIADRDNHQLRLLRPWPGGI